MGGVGVGVGLSTIPCYRAIIGSWWNREQKTPGMTWGVHVFKHVFVCVCTCVYMCKIFISLIDSLDSSSESSQHPKVGISRFIVLSMSQFSIPLPVWLVCSPLWDPLTFIFSDV